MTLPHRNPMEPDWAGLFGHGRDARFRPLLRFGADERLVAEFCRGGLVYLATPYTQLVLGAGDRAARRIASIEASYRASMHVGRLAHHGVTAISPVVLAAEALHADPLSMLDPFDQVFWARWCRPLELRATAVAVPDIAGWSRSRGIWREVSSALSRQVPVFVYGAAEGEAALKAAHDVEALT